MERRAEVEVADVHFDGLREIVWKAGDLDGVDILLDEATGLDANALAIQVSRDVGDDGGLFIDRAEVGMEHSAEDRLMLDGLEECHASAVAFDLEIDNDVFRAAPSKQVVEGLGIDLEIHVFSAFSVNDGGNPAFTAHLIEAARTGAKAWCGFESGLL